MVAELVSLLQDRPCQCRVMAGAEHVGCAMQQLSGLVTPVRPCRDPRCWQNPSGAAPRIKAAAYWAAVSTAPCPCSTHQPRCGFSCFWWAMALSPGSWQYRNGPSVTGSMWNGSQTLVQGSVQTWKVSGHPVSPPCPAE